MKRSITMAGLLLITSLCFAGCKQDSSPDSGLTLAQTDPQAVTAPSNKIQVALLLDTSNSMDGLIEQAKSRLWNIVNTLTTLKYEGQSPEIQIALYEYGNDGLDAAGNYIRQVAPLTTDLDVISEKLFTLKTNGGSEYCGAVIQEATQKLLWGNRSADMKLVYIAGNEGFNQGRISYKEAISDAFKKEIFVNTIYCGSQREGVELLWKDGADIAKGKYFNIDSNRAIEYIDTPYDDRISECNKRMNDTYVNYGAQGDYKKGKQLEQDSNAEVISKANYTERAVSKSKKVYKNDTWDLVDKVKEDKDAFKKIKKEELPKELQNKSTAEVEAYVKQKATDREKLQKEIGELATKRQEYIDTEAKKSKKQDDLGNAIAVSIEGLAKQKGYTIDKNL